MLVYTAISRFLFALALLLLTALTISCGGGGGGGGGGSGGSGGSTAPTVTAVSPPNGATDVASNVTISAGFSTPINGATLTPDTFKLAMGAAPVAGAINYTGLTATFTPNADLTAGTYTATITTGVKDVAGNPLAAAHTWSFNVSSPPDTIRPTVTTTSPLDLATGVALNSVVTATFSETINAATLTNASFTLTGPGDVLNGTVTYDVASRTARFSPSQALKNSTLYTAKISTGVTDAAGNALAADYPWTFTTVADITPPTVLSTFPANGATGVATNSTITAHFSEPMAVGSLTATTFTLSDSGVLVPGGTVTSNGSSATLSVGLQGTTTYTATITTGATDAAGNALASNYSWSFTTAVAPDLTSPSVTSNNPMDGATGISRSTTVSAVFSEAMNPSTLTTSVFTLTNAGPVTASVNYNPATLTATLAPASKLPPLTMHTAQISGAQDAASNALPLTTWSFTTRDGEWGSAQTIESDTGDALNPQVAFDSSGNAIAVWQQVDTGRIKIFANRYTASTASWGTPAVITHSSTDAAYDAGSPKVAVASTGEAIAVWQQGDGTRNNIWFNRFSSSAWGTAAVVDTADGEAVNPQIAFDASGNATVVWQQLDSAPRTNIYSSRYTSAWSVPTTLTHPTTDNLGDAENPQVAIRASGDVMVVWQQYDDSVSNLNRVTNIWANRYAAAGAGWGTATKIDTDPGNARFPHVAIDSFGNAIAVWQQTDGTRNNIWANRYAAAGSGWGIAGLIEIDEVGPAIRPHVAMDISGNAIAVWAQADAGSQFNFYANRFASGSGIWDGAVLIETASAQGVSDPQPQIMFDGNGHALAVWHDGDDVSGYGLSIWSNRYIAGTGWGTAQLIENVSTANASSPRLAVDNNGNAFAIWSQSDGRRGNIYINRFQ